MKFGACNLIVTRYFPPNPIMQNKKDTIIAVIPARYGSTRFPGKALVPIKDRPMIQWVYEGAMRSKLINRVIVATDDERILNAVKSFGGEAMMTSSHHSTGTDRIAEVAKSLDCDIVVNVQGDEPLIRPEMIDEAIAPLVQDTSIPMGTLCKKIEDREEAFDPNVVKVVFDKNSFALYFPARPFPGTATHGPAKAHGRNYPLKAHCTSTSVSMCIAGTFSSTTHTCPRPRSRPRKSSNNFVRWRMGTE